MAGTVFLFSAMHNEAPVWAELLQKPMSTAVVGHLSLDGVGLEIRVCSRDTKCGVTARLTYSLDRNSNQVRFCWEESLPSCTQTLCFALCKEKTSATARNTRAELEGQQGGPSLETGQ